jgi:hypothetical protein
MLESGDLPGEARALLERELPAFTLGSIAADGHGGAGLRREDTHFYTYERPIRTPLSNLLLARNPELTRPRSPAQRAFVAGYIGHLAVDEVWTEQVMRPYFIEPAWGSSSERFLMLNVLLIGMDERDQAGLRPWFTGPLCRARPDGWLPFLPDAALCEWRDLIGAQLEPGATSGTLPIISARTGRSTAELRDLVDSPDALDTRLWAHLPRPALAAAEAQMQAYAVAQVAAYLE